MITRRAGISGILTAAAMMAGMSSVSETAHAQETATPHANAQTAFCFDPNTPEAPRRIRRLTRENAVQIYDACLDADNWREAVQILTSEFDLGPNRFHAIDQILSIYDGKIERQTELNARLQDGARNPETGRRPSRAERRNYEAELLEVAAWLRTVNGAVNIPALIEWRNANAPIVQSITPITGTQCQNEMRITSGLQQSFMTCGTWRAPQTGPLRYNFDVNFESMPPAQAPAAPAQP